MHTHAEKTITQWTATSSVPVTVCTATRQSRPPDTLTHCGCGVNQNTMSILRCLASPIRHISSVSHHLAPSTKNCVQWDISMCSPHKPHFKELQQTCTDSGGHSMDTNNFDHYSINTSVDVKVMVFAECNTWQDNYVLFPEIKAELPNLQHWVFN